MIEYRFAELRNTGRRLSGVGITYGEETRHRLGLERFEAGAFGDVSGLDVILNYQHDRDRPLARTGGGGLTLIDTKEVLEVKAELPATRAADDALELVRAKVLRGFSVEFRSITEERIDNVRSIQKAELSGMGLVDSPAYPGSKVEARVRLGTKLISRIPFAKKLECRCQTNRGAGDCNTVRFSKTTWDESLDNDKQVLGIVGEFSGAIASRSRGGLILTKTEDALEIEITPADTEASRELLRQAEEVPLLMRPIFNNEQFTEVDGVATYESANLRAILIGPTDSAQGWPEVKIERAEPRHKVDELEAHSKRRRRMWL